MTEAELQAEAIGLARKLGVLVGITPDSRRAFTGEPDLRLLGARAMMWAEIKDDDGELSSAQKAWRWRLLACGQIYRLWRPVHWYRGEIKADLEAIH